MMKARMPNILMISKILTLTCVLFLGACDGGIFGTGSGDDLIIPGADTPPSNGVATDESVSDTVEASPSGTDEASETIDGISNVSEAVDETTDTSDEAESTDMSNIDPVSNTAELLIPEAFVNNTPTLTGNTALISLFNASSIDLSVYEATPARQLFGIDGVAPLSLSDSETLSNGINSLAIVNAQDVSATLVSYQNFTVAQSSLTTIVAVQAEQGFDARALVTETTTNDPTLARVRVVDAGLIDADSSMVSLTLLATGAEPSGVDIEFASLNSDNTNSEYLDVPTGEYELGDELNLITPQTLSFSGGTVYTIIFTGAATDEIFVVNDTLMGE